LELNPHQFAILVGHFEHMINNSGDEHVFLLTPE